MAAILPTLRSIRCRGCAGVSSVYVHLGLIRPSRARIVRVPLVSLIVPVLDDALAAGALVASLDPNEEVEVVIVDGGRETRIDGLAAGRSDIRVVRTTPGRARQMNAGAAVAAAPWLLFLHADSRLPHGWL